jgi:hypothetical protein
MQSINVGHVRTCQRAATIDMCATYWRVARRSQLLRSVFRPLRATTARGPCLSLELSGTQVALA